MILSGQVSSPAGGEGGITNFPTIEEVRANWTAVNLVTHPLGDVIHLPPSGIILAFIIGRIDDAIDQGIIFLEVKQNQEFDFCNLCNEDNQIHVFELYLDRGAIAYDTMISDVFGGEVIVNTTFQSVIYYTTADNFFSK